MFGHKDFILDKRRIVRGMSDVDFPQDGTPTGKFIRVGNLFVTAPYDIRYPKLHFAHFDLVRRIKDDFTLNFLTPELLIGDNDIEPIASFTYPTVNRQFGLNDAGYISIDSDTDPSNVALYGASGDFTRADEVGRERSAAILQKILGASALVVIGKEQ